MAMCYPLLIPASFLFLFLFAIPAPHSLRFISTTSAHIIPSLCCSASASLPLSFPHFIRTPPRTTHAHFPAIYIPRALFIPTCASALHPYSCASLSLTPTAAPFLASNSASDGGAGVRAGLCVL
ncbi:hypothetical protein DFH09DRAFT_1124207 [Mycena vulgaris]|nr:hypothetical protein DFH09DRAFT_1124207 [Mycena vulgaris]